MARKQMVNDHQANMHIPYWLTLASTESDRLFSLFEFHHAFGNVRSTVVIEAELDALYHGSQLSVELPPKYRDYITTAPRGSRPANKAC